MPTSARKEFNLLWLRANAVCCEPQKQPLIFMFLISRSVETKQRSQETKTEPIITGLSTPPLWTASLPRYVDSIAPGFSSRLSSFLPTQALPPAQAAGMFSLLRLLEPKYLES